MFLSILISALVKKLFFGRSSNCKTSAPNSIIFWEIARSYPKNLGAKNKTFLPSSGLMVLIYIAHGPSFR